MTLLIIVAVSMLWTYQTGLCSFSDSFSFWSVLRICHGASSVFLTLQMRSCTKLLFFLFHVSPLQTLPIGLIGQICAAQNFLSTSRQPCGGKAVGGSIRLVLLASLSRSIKGFKSSDFLSPGESALRST